jgi:hypothetical protein
MAVFLKEITLNSMGERNQYPFNIPAYSQGIDIAIKSSVLILV